MAPMEGLTDSPFRSICVKYGADLVFSEVVHVDTIIHAHDKCRKMLEFSSKEHPYIIQIKGKDPDNFRKVLEILKPYKPDGIDINFGCPAKRAIRSESCVALLHQPALAKKIIQTVVKHSPFPVSIKTRIGIGQVKLLDFLKKIQVNKLGLAGFTLHGRTKEQGFAGAVDYQIMKQVKKYLQMPMLANGGIYNVADAQTMLEKTNADGVMIARGAVGRPWIFKSMKDGTDYTPNLKEIKRLMLDHARLNYKFKGQHGIIEMRKHLAWYTKGFSGAKRLRSQLVRVETIKDIQSIIKDIKA